MADPSRASSERSRADRSWPALDIILRASDVEAEADVEGHLLAFLDDHAPTAITAPPGREDGWLVSASADVTPAWLAPPDSGAPDTVASPHAWRVFFASAEARAAARAALATSAWASRLDLADVDVHDEGWAERSQASLTAVRVGRLIVAPPWDIPSGFNPPAWPANANTPAAQPAPRSGNLAPSRDLDLAPSRDLNLAPSGDLNLAQSGDRRAPEGGPSFWSPLPRDGAIGGEGRGERVVLVIIEPSMGFGTGHHQSTRLCLQALQAIDLHGQRVLDLGTGSGVLAIASARLGARAVIALDHDRDAVDAARANARLNQVDALVETRQADLTRMAPETADVVLANLTGALLRRHAAIITACLHTHGLLVVSGFTQDERLAVAHALCEARELQLLREDREDGWMSLMYKG